MESFEGFKKPGTFVVAPGVEVQGELILNGANTTLDLFSKDFFTTHALPDGCVTGMFHDRAKVSLVQCITTSGPGSGTRGKESYHFSSVFPHFAIFGDEHLRPSDRKIVQASFLIDDATSVFYDFDAFGSVFDGRDHMERIAKSKELVGRKIEIGEHPHIFYFNGKREIASAKTTLGTVSATHNYGYSMPGPSGIKVENKIYVNVAYEKAATIAEAIDGIRTLLEFLEVIAGRPQNVLRLQFLLESAKDNPTILDVYWCMPPKRKTDGGGKPHPADLPIQAARHPEHFAEVLQKWLARHDEWRNARFRFSSSFSNQNHFTIDRIVGAANMFDILPASAVPLKVTLPQDIRDAKTTCAAIFKKLPTSQERESVMNALGRLGKSTLRQKINSRVKLITDKIPETFPEFDLVVSEAVNCRNYFVHGSKTKIDYGKDFDLVTFYTEALEFIFAASDLLECGWDIKAWSKQRSTVSHPFDRFRHSYDAGLNELKKALAAAKPVVAAPAIRTRSRHAAKSSVQ